LCALTSARERTANFFAETAFFSLELDCSLSEYAWKKTGVCAHALKRGFLNTCSSVSPSISTSISRKFDGSSEVEALSSYGTFSDKHGRRNGILTTGSLALPTFDDSVRERSGCSDYTTISDLGVRADETDIYTLPATKGLGTVRSVSVNSRWPLAMSNILGDVERWLLRV
jgi:hypothetical protein